MKSKITLFLFLFISSLIGVSQKCKVWRHNSFEEVTNQSSIQYSIFLIGDAGEPVLEGEDAVLANAEKRIKAMGNQSSVIFLGDNIYRYGLPDLGAPDRAVSEQKLKKQLDIVNGYKGKTYVIPGNHDWNKGHEGGLEYVKRQADYVNAYPNIDFIPDNGCAGPIEIPVDDSLTIVVFDSQWWLHQHERTVDDSLCAANTELEVIGQLDAILTKNKDKKVLVAAHHPLYSNGSHNGYFPLSTHLFPLRDVNKSLWIPLPGLGSIYPAYRKFFGSIQDIPHPHYQLMKQNLVELFKEHGNVIYACGHEHNLQYFEKDDFPHILSGSGSKSTFLRKRRGALFVSEHKGYAQVDYLTDGSSVIKFWGVDKEGVEQLLYTREIKTSLFQDRRQEEEVKDSVTVVPGEYFKAGKFKQKVFGSLYRDIWQVPVTVPVLDLRTAKGGLTPTQQGGGLQTRSLRLVAKDGREYVVRSIEKFPDKALPELIRKTVAVKVVKDQIASSHPHGAFLVPEMAEAAGVYHANPKMYYLPDTKALGNFREDFGGILVLFEERLSSTQADQKFFGASDKIKSTLKVVDKLHADHDNQVNQQQVLRSRLFDNVISDWDRHDDQWKWASYKTKKGHIYEPIPRDRDQAFYHINGFLPNITNRKWALRKLQNFQNETRDIDGLNFNGRYFDRSFLTNLEWEDWQKEIAEIQKGLTKEVIDEAFKAAPDGVNKLRPETRDIVLYRVEHLEEHARHFYKTLAKEVDVVGSNKREDVEITRINNDSTKVQMWSVSKKGNRKKLIFDRTFLTDETKEIRIFTLDGDDKITTKGKVKKGPKVRLIPGLGNDEVLAEAKVTGLGKKTITYDNKDTKIEGSQTKKKLADTEAIHEYNRKAFKYDVLTPLITGGFNADDRIFIGTGFIFTKHGFRKEPYRYRQALSGKFATSNGSFDIKYRSDYKHVLGKWDLYVDANAQAPNFLYNFYGFGNESVRVDSLAGGVDIFYRVRLNRYNGSLGFQKEIGKSKFRFGVKYEYVEVEDPEEIADRLEEDGPRFITSNELLTSESAPSILEVQEGVHYASLEASYDYDGTDSKVFPTHGFKFHVDGSLNRQLDERLTGDQNEYAHAKSNFNFYVSKGKYYPITLAYRIGGSVNGGDFDFFQNNTIGGLQQVRGFNRTRFAGDATLYQNIELRLKLRNIQTFLFPGKLGVLTFFDSGKAYDFNEASRRIHYGVGGGVWLNLYEMANLTATYARSEERTTFLIQFKLFY